MVGAATLNGQARGGRAPNSPAANGAANGRRPDGTFAPGNPGGPGRKPRPTEQRYLQTMMSVCSLEDWRQITLRAVQDAKQGDSSAREWLAKYLVGLPGVVAPTVTEALAAELTGDDARGVALEGCRQVQRGCEEAARHQEGVFAAIKHTVAERLGTLDAHV
jgi:hypothetical protein